MLKEKNTGASARKKGKMVCPCCGKQLVLSERSVITAFPAPPLEVFECPVIGCHYSRCVKLDLG